MQVLHLSRIQGQITWRTVLTSGSVLGLIDWILLASKSDAQARVAIFVIKKVTDWEKANGKGMASQEKKNQQSLKGRTLDFLHIHLSSACHCHLSTASKTHVKWLFTNAIGSISSYQSKPNLMSAAQFCKCYRYLLNSWWILVNSTCNSFKLFQI